MRVCAVCFGNEMKMRVKASLMMNAGKVGKQKMPNSKSKIRKRESTQSVLRCKMAGSTRGRVAQAGEGGRTGHSQAGKGGTRRAELVKPSAACRLSRQPRDVTSCG